MKIIRIRSGIVLVEICERFLLVADKKARKDCTYFREINETGAFIWNCLQNEKTINEIIEMMKREYEISENLDINTEVETFIEQLKKYKYLID